MSDITKKALAVSLKKLLLKKPLDKITVKDITDQCGVNRQTFYYHFDDVADLIEYICISDCEEVLGNNKTYNTWQEGFLAIFDLMVKDKPFIMNIFYSVSLETIQLYLYRMVFNLIYNVVDEESKGKNISKENKSFIADFYKYGFVGLVFDWVKRGMNDDPNLIIDRLSQLVKGSIRNAVDNLSA